MNAFGSPKTAQPTQNSTSRLTASSRTSNLLKNHTAIIVSIPVSINSSRTTGISFGVSIPRRILFPLTSRIVTVKASKKGRSPLMHGCGLLLEGKIISGRGSTSTSVTCRPLLWGQPSNPAYRLFLSDHIFPSLPMLSYTTLFDCQAFYQS